MGWDASAATSAMRAIEAAYLIGVEGATEVWLVRHGDCYEGLAGRDGGPEHDPPLSALGRDQARRLGARMAGIRVDRLYSSPALRACETAAAIGEQVLIEPRLAEVETDISDGRVQVIEPSDQVVTRMSAAVEDAVAAAAGGRVVMVGHGVAILMYVCEILRLQFGQLRLLPYYTSVNVVRVLGERRMVGWLGDTGHLVD